MIICAFLRLPWYYTFHNYPSVHRLLCELYSILQDGFDVQLFSTIISVGKGFGIGGLNMLKLYQIKITDHFFFFSTNNFKPVINRVNGIRPEINTRILPHSPPISPI
ncbi:hypothetical protein C21_04019 [Arenibacter sp. NBRC 103722]|nr:hypothetical protein C21_04019 [Arenibacter sp. NBRC 103722]